MIYSELCFIFLMFKMNNSPDITIVGMSKNSNPILQYFNFFIIMSFSSQELAPISSSDSGHFSNINILLSKLISLFPIVASLRFNSLHFQAYYRLLCSNQSLRVTLKSIYWDYLIQIITIISDIP